MKGARPACAAPPSAWERGAMPTWPGTPLVLQLQPKEICAHRVLTYVRQKRTLFGHSV